MSNLLLYLTNMVLAVFGLITGYLIILALLALVGLLPMHMDSIFELPIQLRNAETYYVPFDEDTQFKSTHIEVKKANLEILPENRTWPQAIGYLLFLPSGKLTLLHYSWD